jgi:RNA polymerase sigma factor (sigma-70 family)
MPRHPYTVSDLAPLGDVDLVRLARECAREEGAAHETSKRAIAVVLVRHRSLIRSSIAAKVPADAIDDLVSEVHVRFVRRVYAGGEVLNAPGLLMRMAQRVRADFLEGRKRQAPVASDDGEAGADDPALEDAAITESLEQMLAVLSERQREVVWQRIIEGKSSAEVAERLNTSPGNIDVILHRALKVMREQAQ